MQTKIGVPLRESDKLKLIREINGNETSKIQIEDLIKSHNKKKTTIIRMNLYENGNPIRLVTFQEPGWTKYQSFNLSINQNKTKLWNDIVRTQGKIKFTVNKDKDPNEFFEQFLEFNEDSFIKHLFREFKKPVEGQIKTQIDIDFEEPIEGSWDLVQEIVIKVERISDDIIQLDKLLLGKNMSKLFLL
ncbi:hypothetical protein [Peribacillus frigoritolerans]|uniref:hypothetical protein n=1 Tax=Peribacillus frigoritolerans TaxID=450367 RepID=UPI001F4FD9F8|nr:hypothetical protein [Peribacillus frigoritolerans]MCK2016351.1 hypothetical protein [Peribacillus frigoritolerans]